MKSCHSLCFAAWLAVFLTSSQAWAVPVILGHVFSESNGSTTPIGNASIELYRDNGDGVFDSTDTMVLQTTTDASGNYQFDNLHPDVRYFVRQPEQALNGSILSSQVSSLKNAAQPQTVIDTFFLTHNLVASPISKNPSSVVRAPNQTQILGLERDDYLLYHGGAAEAKLRSNPFSLGSSLRFEATAGTTALAVLTWDGIDDNAAMQPAMGLGGLDLTGGGKATGLMVRLGIDAAGMGETVMFKIFSGDVVSQAEVEIPYTGGEPTGFVFLPFEGFTGEASATHVDAVQMILDATLPSVDAQFDLLATLGPVVQDFLVTVTPVPEPQTLMGCFVGGMMLAVLRRRRRRPGALATGPGLTDQTIS